MIFTPGITHSLNYFIKGFLKPGDHVIVSGLEHNAVMRPLYQMSKRGVSYDVAHTDSEGLVDITSVEALIRPETKAIVMTHASNVCGTVVPIKEIGTLCEKYQIFFVLDSAQSAGTIDVNMQECKIDFLAFTGHKGLLGPQGIGGFLISDKLNAQMDSFIAGGTGSISDSYGQGYQYGGQQNCRNPRSYDWQQKSIHQYYDSIYRINAQAHHRPYRAGTHHDFHFPQSHIYPYHKHYDRKAAGNCRNV